LARAVAALPRETSPEPEVVARFVEWLYGLTRDVAALKNDD